MTTQPTPEQIEAAKACASNAATASQGRMMECYNMSLHPVENIARILLAALEAAERDRERLDWLQLYLSDFTKNVSGPTSGGPGWEFGYNAGPGYMVDGYGETLREAIDAARKAQP